MDRISFADAVVALRSLPRRFTEVLSGPPDDDAWDRIVRFETGTPPRSAMGWAAAAAALVSSLADALDALPKMSKPSVDLRDEHASSFRPDPTATVADVLATIAAVSSRAATALAGRRPEDDDRAVIIDGREGTLGELVTQVVTEATGAIRTAQSAIDAATR